MNRLAADSIKWHKNQRNHLNFILTFLCLMFKAFKAWFFLTNSEMFMAWFSTNRKVWSLIWPHIEAIFIFSYLNIGLKWHNNIKIYKTLFIYINAMFTITLVFKHKMLENFPVALCMWFSNPIAGLLHVCHAFN